MDNFSDKYKEKKNPFSVPDGYFDDLTERVMQRIEEKPQKVRFLTLVRPYLGLAAIFVLALVIAQVVLPGVVDKKQILVKDRGQVVQFQETAEEDIFDSHFNPSNEEIIEYLTIEVDEYELLYAVL